jgi:hypothetical protein
MSATFISADHLCLGARSLRNLPFSYPSIVGDTISEVDRSLQQCQAASPAGLLVLCVTRRLAAGDLICPVLANNTTSITPKEYISPQHWRCTRNCGIFYVLTVFGLKMTVEVCKALQAKLALFLDSF